MVPLATNTAEGSEYRNIIVGLEKACPRLAFRLMNLKSDQDTG